MRTAAIYARYSSSKQREASIDDQLRVCTRWCADNGYAVVATYCDPQYSGRTDERPAFKRMADNAGESDIVLVYMMDRFSRDVYDAAVYKRHFREHGVQVVSAMEAVPDGPEAILVESMYDALAAMESAKISQRTARGMEGNALKCMHNGVPVFGYRFGADGRYEVDEDAAAMVRRAFELRQDGHSENAIARWLADRGVTTTRGTPASHTFVHTMLHNRKYVGVYSFGGVEVEGGMPAIVDGKVFDMVQGMARAKRCEREDWDDYALAGKGICGRCSMSLVGVSGRGRNGRKYTYYRCAEKCGVRPMRADALEDAVAGAVRALLDDPDAMREVVEAVGRYAAAHSDDSARLDAERRMREAVDGMENLARAVREGMPYELAAPQIAELERMHAAAVADASLAAPTFDLDDFADFMRFGTALDDDALLRAFVWQVLLGDDTVEIVLNYDLEDGSAARVSLERGSIDGAFGVDGCAENECEPPATWDDGTVRTKDVWLPECVEVRNGQIVITLARAA